MRRKAYLKKLIPLAIITSLIAGNASLTAMATPVVMPDGTIFDRDYYAAMYPDVVMALGSDDAQVLYRHYVDHGKGEGRLAAAPGAVAPQPPQVEDTSLKEDNPPEESPDSLLEETREESPVIQPAPSVRENMDKEDPRNAFRNKLVSIRQKRDKSQNAVNSQRGPLADPVAFYKNTVFVGDSIMLGFRNYAAKKSSDPLLSELNFLAAGSFGANNALKPVGKNSVHPVYKGQQRPVWESISMMGCSKMFMLVGLNDLNICGLDGSLERYEEVLNKIKAASPNIQINIISMPYVLAGSEKGKLNNNSIREYNEMLKAFTAKNGYGYVDIATALQDSKGNLDPKYCSDGFLHQTAAAYDEWVKVLMGYAG